MSKYYKYLDHSNKYKSYEKEDSVKPSFDGVKQGHIFNINRPAFRSNTQEPINRPLQTGALPVKRTGTGNYDLFRNNFRAADIMGRYTIDFDKLELQNIASEGIKVQLGDKTLRDLFQIKVDDPSDKQWLDEYNLRIRNGMTPEQAKNSLPLGRKQRQISKQINIGEASQTNNLSLVEKIDLLSAQLRQDAIENKTEIIEVTSRLLIMLGESIDQVIALGDAKHQELLAVIGRLHINPDPNVYFQNKLQFNNTEYQANKGKILLYLLANLPQNFTFNEPLNGITGRPISIRTIDNQLQANAKRRLDVSLHSIIELP